jgi:hypothetical protein
MGQLKIIVENDEDSELAESEVSMDVLWCLRRANYSSQIQDPGIKTSIADVSGSEPAIGEPVQKVGKEVSRY